MRSEKITFACITKPHLDRLKALIPKVMPYVDRAVIVIGERDSEVEKYLKSFGSKMSIVYKEWKDNFAAQWNIYLQYIEDGWVLLCDDDEIPSEDLLDSLDDYINNSDQGNKYCHVAFRCNPISEGQDMGPCNYWRQLFFRYNIGMHYRGGPKTGCHQYIVGYQNGRGIDDDVAGRVYYHVKPLEDEYRNAARNYFIYGIWKHGSSDGEQREEWHALKTVLANIYPQVKVFPDLDKIMKAGHIHSSLIDWMTRTYNTYREHPDYNETRALVVYYFRYLHPEEKPEELEL